MKNGTLILFYIFLLLFTLVAQADEINKLTQVTCIPELGYFRIQAISIENGYDGIPPFEQHKFNISDEQICKIGNDNFHIKVYYEAPRSRGINGGEAPGHLTIKKNTKTIINDLLFNAIGFYGNVTSVEYYNNGNYFSLSGVLDTDASEIYQVFHIIVKKYPFNKRELFALLNKAAHPSSTSFDCKKATSNVDKIICNYPVLGASDRSMAQEYKMLQSELNPEARKKLLNEQRLWLKNRIKECAIPNEINFTEPAWINLYSHNPYIKCLEKKYKDRGELLSQKRLRLVKDRH